MKTFKEFLTEAMEDDWTTVKNSSGNVIYIKGDTTNAKQHKFSIYLDKKGEPIKTGLLNKAKIAPNHKNGDYDSLFENK